MVTCDSCGKQLNRHIFCSAACKVRYHRGVKPTTTIDTALNTPQAVKQAISNPEQPQFSDNPRPGYHLVNYLGKYIKD